MRKYNNTYTTTAAAITNANNYLIFISNEPISMNSASDNRKLSMCIILKKHKEGCWWQRGAVGGAFHTKTNEESIKIVDLYGKRQMTKKEKGKKEKEGIQKYSQ